MAHWILVPLAAFIAATINAIAGGGTFITFPALTGIAGLSEKAANITSTVGIWPGTAASVAVTRAEFSRLPRAMMIAYAIISVFGGAAGALLLLSTSAHSFKLVIPWLLAFATLIFSFSKPIARWAGRQHGDRSTRWTILVGCIQFTIAIYGGYFGAGAGVLMLAGLAFAGLDNIYQMNAMKVLLGALINGISCIIFIFGPVAWGLAAAMAVAAVLGGIIGMKLSRKIRQDYLRALIILVGVTLTLVYFAKNY